MVQQAVGFLPDWALGQLICVLGATVAAFGLFFMKDSADLEAGPDPAETASSER